MLLKAMRDSVKELKNYGQRVQGQRLGLRSLCSRKVRPRV